MNTLFPRLVLAFMIILLSGFVTSTTTYIVDGVRYESREDVKENYTTIQAEVGLFGGLLPISKQ
jgi:hypothetical protein